MDPGATTHEATSSPVDDRGSTDAPRPNRSFQVRYVLALVAIAGMAVGIWWIGALQLEVQSTDAAVVNVAGRQRMLSQRVALLGGMYDQARAMGQLEESERIAGLLAADARDMVDGQRALLDGDPDRNLPGNPSPTVLAMYADGTRDAVEQHAADALALVDASYPSQRTRLVLALQQRAVSPFLSELDAIVGQYQREAEARIDQGVLAQRAILVSMLGVLLLVGLFVFRPMDRRLTRETGRLEEVARRHAQEAARHQFGLQVRDAIGFADSEADLVDAVGHSVDEAGMGSAELLLTGADAPDRLLPVLTAAPTGCSVREVDACPALRRSRTLEFSRPDVLGGCPRFRHDAGRAERGDISSVCVPITFLGRGVGVLRGVEERGGRSTAEDVEQLEQIARTAGTHLGTLRAFARTRAAAQRDPLTGLLNRRGLESELDAIPATGTRVVLAIDLDHFKQVNDHHGHAAGDAVLASTAELITQVCRPGDLVARTGGEEFVIVAGSDGDTTDALRAGALLAERVRHTIAARPGQHGLPAVTASIGVAGPVTAVLDQVLARADAALYRAKDEGRNRVVVDGQDVAVAEQPAQVLGPGA